MLPGREPEIRIRRGIRAYHPPFHAKGVAVDGLRRSPGSRVRMLCIRIGKAAFPEFFWWPAAVSSLTVARQRGSCTRFPVFAEGQRRAVRRIWERAKEPCEEFSGWGGWKSNGARLSRLVMVRARCFTPPGGRLRSA